MGYIKSAVDWIHTELTHIIKEGDICVDATCGNGYDTLHLAHLAGENGHVFAFDIQQEAMDKTRTQLNNMGLEDSVTLILAGHEEINKYIDQKIKVAVFNLGYLPGGDHSITTRGESTLLGIKNAMTLLDSGGIIFIALYWGHREGQLEKETVLAFAHNLAKENWAVMEICFPNRLMAPYLIVIEKKL